jgi:hypothetical protein
VERCWIHDGRHEGGRWAEGGREVAVLVLLLDGGGRSGRACGGAAPCGSLAAAPPHARRRERRSATPRAFPSTCGIVAIALHVGHGDERLRLVALALARGTRAARAAAVDEGSERDEREMREARGGSLARKGGRDGDERRAAEVVDLLLRTCEIRLLVADGLTRVPGRAEAAPGIQAPVAFQSRELRVVACWGGGRRRKRDGRWGERAQRRRAKLRGSRGRRGRNVSGGEGRG